MVRKLFVGLVVVVFVIPMVLNLATSPITGWPLTIFFSLFSLLCLVTLWRYVRKVLRTIDQVTLRLLCAEPADPHLHARLINLVDGLSATSGVAAPSLYVINDAAPNALTIAPASGSNKASVAVTTGLLGSLNRMELEGALAHELAKVKNDEPSKAAAYVATAGFPLLVSDRLAAGENGVGLRALGVVTRPLVKRSTAKLSDATTSDATLLADQTAASFTRYPPGLIGALDKIEHHQGEPQLVGASTRHLWTAPPHGSNDSPQLPIQDRIASLGEL